MSFMKVVRQKLQRSLQLVQRAVLVIRKYPNLLVFPLVTGLLTAGIALFFLAPVALVLLAPHWAPGAKLQALADHIALIRFNTGFNFQVRPLGTLILAELYLLNLFVATMASVERSQPGLFVRPLPLRHGTGRRQPL